jgi:hypothetical protein
MILTDEEREKEFQRGKELYKIQHPRSLNVYEEDAAGLYAVEQAIIEKLSSMTPEKRIEEIAELVAIYEGWNKNVVKRSEDYEDYIELARQILTLCSPSPDKAREILIRHFEPVDVDEKVDFAYSLTTCVNEICGGIE